MKNILLPILVLSVLIGISQYENNYTRENCIVVDATETGAIFEDGCGFTWYLEEDGFEIGDVVDLKMHTNNTTSYIDDDVITKVVMQKGK